MFVGPPGTSPSPEERRTMTTLPNPYPPVWIDVTVRERQQQAFAAAEHARRLSPLRRTRRGRPAIVGDLLQAIGTALVRTGRHLQGASSPPPASPRASTTGR
jgi:hypothetical protein